VADGALELRSYVLMPSNIEATSKSQNVGSL
jgi:hypothetical protein